MFCTQFDLHSKIGFKGDQHFDIESNRTTSSVTWFVIFDFVGGGIGTCVGDCLELHEEQIVF